MDEKRETVADIVAEMRNPCDNNICPYWKDGGDCASCPLGGAGKNCIFANIADRIEAAARRAYNEIDESVCAAEDLSSVDIDYIRMHMKNTIGDYYE